MSRHQQGARDGTREMRVCAADIGGSHVTAAVVELGPEPRILARSNSDYDADSDRETLLGTMVDTLRGAAADARQWVIALPGPFDYERGSGSFEGVAKFRALAGVDLRSEFSSRLGIAGDRIRFVNDAIAYGIGEWSVSPDRPVRFACITLGTGIGSAFLDCGQPIESGPEVPPHGWAHLLEIDGEPLEDWVSTRAIQRRYAEAGGGMLSVREITDRARREEPRASIVIEAAMVDLGCALAPWFARFLAREVVVGGSMARSWDVLGPAFERGVENATSMPVRIRPSRLFDDAPLIGAAAYR
ncbi:MAG: hypothetical protein JWP75_689 [Frondihabitans sp.]|nr:hypothetical protein [Frondihabitans sp.]